MFDYMSIWLIMTMSNFTKQNTFERCITRLQLVRSSCWLNLRVSMIIIRPVIYIFFLSHENVFFKIRISWFHRWKIRKYTPLCIRLAKSYPVLWWTQTKHIETNLCSIMVWAARTSLQQTTVEQYTIIFSYIVQPSSCSIHVYTTGRGIVCITYYACVYAP